MEVVLTIGYYIGFLGLIIAAAMILTKLIAKYSHNDLTAHNPPSSEKEENSENIPDEKEVK